MCFCFALFRKSGSSSLVQFVGGVCGGVVLRAIGCSVAWMHSLGCGGFCSWVGGLVAAMGLASYIFVGGTAQCIFGFLWVAPVGSAPLSFECCSQEELLGEGELFFALRECSRAAFLFLRHRIFWSIA